MIFNTLIINILPFIIRALAFSVNCIGVRPLTPTTKKGTACRLSLFCFCVLWEFSGIRNNYSVLYCFPGRLRTKPLNSIFNKAEATEEGVNPVRMVSLSILMVPSSSNSR